MTVPTGVDLAVDECKALLARGAATTAFLREAEESRSGRKISKFLDLYR